MFQRRRGQGPCSQRAPRAGGEGKGILSQDREKKDEVGKKKKKKRVLSHSWMWRALVVTGGSRGPGCHQVITAQVIKPVQGRAGSARLGTISEALRVQAASHPVAPRTPGPGRCRLPVY